MGESTLSRLTGEFTLSARPGRRSATGLLTVYLFLLFALPARLIFAPLGAIGTPAAMLAMFSLFLWLGSRLLPSVSKPESQPVRWALGVFAFAVMVSYLAGMLGTLPKEDTTAADLGLFKLAAMCGVALLAADGIRDTDAMEKFLSRLVLAVTLVAVIGVLQFPTGFSLDFIQIPGLTANRDLLPADSRGGFFRIQSTTLHPIELAVVLAMTLPIALYRAMIAPRGWVARFRWASVAVMILALPMTISRTALLCLVVVVALLVPTWPGKYVLGAVVLGLLGVVAAVIAAPDIVQVFVDLVINISRDPSFTGRTDDYALVGDFIYANPLFGRGFGTFDPVAYVLLDNQYIGTLIEMGALGLLALLTLFMVGIASARGARRRSTHTFDRARGHAIAVSLIAAMVAFAVFDALAFPTVTSLLMLMLGCAGAAWRIAVKGEQLLARAALPVPIPVPSPSAQPEPVTQAPAVTMQERHA